MHEHKKLYANKQEFSTGLRNPYQQIINFVKQIIKCFHQIFDEDKSQIQIKTKTKELVPKNV